MPLPAFTEITKLPLIDRIKAYIIGAFSALVAIAFLATLGSMIYFKVKDPSSDIELWLNVFLTCLGYIVGILTGLLGIPTPSQPAPRPAASNPPAGPPQRS